ncbi:MAG: UpxY family transcription antiterminator [Thermodesulfovibrionales bacterium]|nr:UpxY family transcription antiterminator [Thermodesulfovibrionales bacterium]
MFSNNWYAVYVKSRHEFKTYNALVQKNIETFLPVIKILRHWKDRKKMIDFPLFPGYLFVYMEARPEYFLSVLRTKGVVRFLCNDYGRPASISTEEIESLKILLGSPEQINVYPELQEGIRIRVKNGPLKGAEGIIKKKDDSFLFVVNIHILGRSVAVKLYGSDLEVA